MKSYNLNLTVYGPKILTRCDIVRMCATGNESVKDIPECRFGGLDVNQFVQFDGFLARQLV